MRAWKGDRSMPVPIFRDIEAIRTLVSQRRHLGQKVALVPTMGALHEGHLRLVDEGLRLAQAIIVSIFVNPLQFGPHEDFSRYPRDLEHDIELLESRPNVHLFMPTTEVMYPQGPGKTVIDLPGLTNVLCGVSRPTHFSGVATVVAKLLNIVTPDVAIFGQKDAQQLVVIQRMVQDLNFPTKIVGVPTVRESSGLAMSSRNRYLTDLQKERAAAIFRTLNDAQRLVRSGQVSMVRTLTDTVKGVLESSGLDPEYVHVVDPDSLQELMVVGRDIPALLAVAVHLGSARLIDNIRLDG